MASARQVVDRLFDRRLRVAQIIPLLKADYTLSDQVRVAALKLVLRRSSELLRQQYKQRAD